MLISLVEELVSHSKKMNRMRNIRSHTEKISGDIRTFKNTDPAIFVSDLKDDNKSYFLFSKFLCLYLFEGTFTSFFKDKKP
jgi:hypothetical protein